MGSHNTNPHRRSDLLIDPSIWYPDRKLTTGMVRSLPTAIQTSAEYANLRSYVRDGLAMKYARKVWADDILSTYLSPTPSVVTDSTSLTSTGSPSTQSTMPSTISTYKDGYSSSFSDSPEFARERPAFKLLPGSQEEISGHTHRPSFAYPKETPTRQPLAVDMRPSKLWSSPTSEAGTSTSTSAQLASDSYRDSSSTSTTSNLTNWVSHRSLPAKSFTPSAATPSVLYTPPRVTNILQQNSWRTSPKTEPRAEKAHQPTAVPPMVVAPAPPPQLSVSNYRGDPTNPNNMSDEIPDSLNTSVFLEKLPGDLDYPGFLQSLRGTGRIFSVKIMGPVAAGTAKSNTKIDTSAAKVHFWDRTGADRFFALCRAGRLRMGGRVPLARPNYYRTRARPEHESRCSRVIIIEGPCEIVNQPYLKWFFDLAFDWNIEEIIDLEPKASKNTTTTTTRRLEYRFASYRAQAVTAFRRMEHASKGWSMLPNRRGVDLSVKQRALWRDVRVEYGRDPCEPVEETEGTEA